MKKLIFGLLFMSLLFIATGGNAQVIIKIRPAAPTYIIKKGPDRRGHIWVDGDWRWHRRRGEYIWRDPHYMRARRGHVWVPGYWRDAYDGYEWIPGHWAR
jgi:hypothetical protein